MTRDRVSEFKEKYPTAKSSREQKTILLGLHHAAVAHKTQALRHESEAKTYRKIIKNYKDGIYD